MQNTMSGMPAPRYIIRLIVVSFFHLPAGLSPAIHRLLSANSDYYRILPPFGFAHAAHHNSISAMRRC